MNTPGLYIVPELRYPCYCCCRRPPPCPPPPHCRHHHEADALDVFDVHAKHPDLYQVSKLRNLNLIFFDGGTTDGVTYTIRWSRIITKFYLNNWSSYRAYNKEQGQESRIYPHHTVSLSFIITSATQRNGSIMLVIDPKPSPHLSSSEGLSVYPHADTGTS